MHCEYCLRVLAQGSELSMRGLVLLTLCVAKERFYLDKQKLGNKVVLDKFEVKRFGDDPENHKYQLHYNGNRVSFWHDIPFKGPGPTFHFVCEIPKGTTAKMEINKEAAGNPIIQDRKKGKLRFYKYNPEVGSVVNYGAIPQTWESPDEPDAWTKIGGDNDPIDVVQVNAKPCTLGQVQRVEVLGAFALIDDGETDWKLIVQDTDDPDRVKAPKGTKEVLDVISQERLTEIVEWFRNYKTAEGKPLNTFGLDERVISAKEALDVLLETNKQWELLQTAHEEL